MAKTGNAGRELGAHADALRAVSGEHHRGQTAAFGADDHRGAAAAASQQVELGEQFLLAARDHGSAMLERHAVQRERFRDVEQGDVGVGEPVTEPRRLTGQGLRSTGGEQEGQGGRLCAHRLCLDCLRRGRLFEDDVRVGAAHAERGHTCPARPLVLRPRAVLGQHLDPTGRPVHFARRLVHVQRLGEDPVPDGHHGLDHAGDARGRLGVTHVRLGEPSHSGSPSFFLRP